MTIATVRSLLSSPVTDSTAVVSDEGNEDLHSPRYPETMLDGGVKRLLKKKTAWTVVGRYRGPRGSALGREG